MLHHTRHMRYIYTLKLLFLQNKGIPHLLLPLNPPLLIQPLDPPKPPDTDMIVKTITLGSIVGRSYLVYTSNRMLVIPKSGPHPITYQEYIHHTTFLSVRTKPFHLVEVILSFWSTTPTTFLGPRILQSPHQTTPSLARTTHSHVLAGTAPSPLLEYVRLPIYQDHSSDPLGPLLSSTMTTTLNYQDHGSDLPGPLLSSARTTPLVCHDHSSQLPGPRL